MARTGRETRESRSKGAGAFQSVLVEPAEEYKIYAVDVFITEGDKTIPGY